MKKAKTGRVMSPEKFLKVMQVEWRKQWRGGMRDTEQNQIGVLVSPSSPHCKKF